MRITFSQLTVVRYASAIVAVALAVLLTTWLKGLGDSGISPQFFAAVLFCAWFGGLGPGLVATLLSGVATAYLVMSRHANTPAAIQEDLLRPVVFTVVAFLASSLHAATRRVAQEADRAKHAAESANEAKSRFLAMVSHELRTPLSPVMMLTEMLANDPTLPERIRDDVRSIRRNVDVELRLIDDLVDLTRISSGKMKLRLEPLDIEQPLRAAIKVCQADLQAGQLELTTSLAAGHSTIKGDAVRLQQVFWNLLRNAIKFTPPGGRVSVHTGLAADGQLAIEVSDSGIGIEPHRLTAIFQIFEQGGPDITERFGGLGLGLAICQALIEAHGGTIHAASPGLGKGATFTLRLPVLTPSIAANESIDDSARSLLANPTIGRSAQAR